MSIIVKHIKIENKMNLNNKSLTKEFLMEFANKNKTKTIKFLAINLLEIHKKIIYFNSNLFTHLKQKVFKNTPSIIIQLQNLSLIKSNVIKKLFWILFFSILVFKFISYKQLLLIYVCINQIIK